jgi:Beta/Gamma crystallin
MKRWMLGLLTVLFSATLATAQQQPTTPVTPQRGDIPQIVAFDNDGLLGDHIHIFGDTPDLGKWGNSISSMVILAGRWEFFDEEKFQGPKVELGPGIYLHVKDHGMKDNSISSIRLVGSLPDGTVTGAACGLAHGQCVHGQASACTVLGQSHA